MYDYSELRWIIRARLGSEKIFAEKLGITSATLSKKYKSKYGFTQDEMSKTCEILNLNPQENLPPIFFSSKCRENTTT